MDWRSWWTVILTALAGPLGGFGFGVALARLADATTGGMAGLAGGVVGLWLGAPLASLVVFGICLVTLMRGVVMRRWLALLVMPVAVVAEALVVLVGLRLSSGMATPEWGLGAVAIVATGVLGGGAYVALRVASWEPGADPGGSPPSDPVQPSD
ncbi:MAG: hypothetical protein FJW80_07265 [Actinobacteria bacterium]|nr:hypothetical protein [Actinomycetota bacterium]